MTIAEMTDTVLRATDEIERLRLLNMMYVDKLRELYAWFDDVGDGAPDAAWWQRDALRKCAEITEVLEKGGVL